MEIRTVRSERHTGFPKTDLSLYYLHVSAGEQRLRKLHRPGEGFNTRLSQRTWESQVRLFWWCSVIQCRCLPSQTFVAMSFFWVWVYVRTNVWILDPLCVFYLCMFDQLFVLSVFPHCFKPGPYSDGWLPRTWARTKWVKSWGLSRPTPCWKVSRAGRRLTTSSSRNSAGRGG